MAFAHFGKLCHMVFEGLQVSLRLTLQTDHGKNSNAVAQRSRIDHGVVGLDRAAILQRTHTAQARGAVNPTFFATSTLVIRPSSCNSARICRSISSMLEAAMKRQKPFQ